MKAAAILIVMLSQQGYWFAGQDGTIVVRWAARGELPGVDLSWELLFDGVRIASGQAPINPITGCAKKSAGSANCYAEVMVWIFSTILYNVAY